MNIKSAVRFFALAAVVLWAGTVDAAQVLSSVDTGYFVRNPGILDTNATIHDATLHFSGDTVPTVAASGANHQISLAGSESGGFLDIERRPYYIWDISSVTGPIQTASISLWCAAPSIANGDSGCYNSGDGAGTGTETFMLHSVGDQNNPITGEPITAVDVANAMFMNPGASVDDVADPDVAIFADLGASSDFDGDPLTTDAYASKIFDVSDEATGHYVEFILNSAAISSLQAILDGSTTVGDPVLGTGKFWAAGGAVSTLDFFGKEQLFGGSQYDGTTSLDGDGNIPFPLLSINVSSVPIPAAAWLFGSGIIGLVGLSRRRSGTA